MFPDVDDENLAGRQGEEGALALKVLVLAAFSAVGSLHVHDENIVRHLGGAAVGALPLVLGHPYSLGRLAALRLGHDTKFGAEEMVEESRLACRLGAEDGDEMVIEAGLGDVGPLEVSIEVRAKEALVSDLVSQRRQTRRSSWRAEMGKGGRGGIAYLNSLSSSITCIPCSKSWAVGPSPTAEKWPFMTERGGGGGAGAVCITSLVWTGNVKIAPGQSSSPMQRKAYSVWY